MQNAAIIFQGTLTTIHSQALDFQEIIEILRAPDASLRQFDTKCRWIPCTNLLVTHEN